MLELYHNNMSVCAQKVRLTLAEKGVQAVEHHLNLRAADQHKPEYLKLNPKAYVPTLVHNGTVVTESSIICEYLDETFQQPQLMPDEPSRRAVVRQWTRRPDERIHVACVVVSNTIAFRHQWLSRPAEELAQTIANTPDYEIRERRRDIIEHGIASPRFKTAVKAYDGLLADMEDALSASPWLGGDRYTLADIAITPYVNRLAQLQQHGLWASRPNVGRWLAQVNERPNFTKAIKSYDDAAYIELMKSTGEQHWPDVRQAAKAA